jgi:hypothetical protein
MQRVRWLALTGIVLALFIANLITDSRSVVVNYVGSVAILAWIIWQTVASLVEKRR